MPDPLRRASDGTPDASTDPFGATATPAVQTNPYASTVVSEPPASPYASTVVSDVPPRPPPSADPLVGRTLRHFRVDAPLGAGGMGAVYRAWDTSLDRPVAIKVLLVETESARVRFLREARAQAKLGHPNVVPIHFVGEADGVSFLVMDLVEGESLASLLERQRLETERALDVVAAVAGALEAGSAHGLVHRDVKPSNILIERTGRVLLADFGLAKATASTDAAGGALAPAVPSQRDPGTAERGAPLPGLTRAGAVIGTPAYLAPEQAAGEPVDFRADIYALGITLYEAITGHPPFTASSVPEMLEAHKTQPAPAPRTLSAAVSPAVDALVMRMIAKRPEDRFASYAELLRAIGEARARPTIAAPLVSRIVAFWLDAMLFVVPTVAVWMLLEKVVGEHDVNSAFATPLFALLLGAADAYWGRTLGKRWMRLRAVDAFDAPVRGLRAIARAQLKLWGPTADALVLAAIPDHEGWGTLRIAVNLILLGVWAVEVCVGMASGRGPWHDRLLGTRVIVAVDPRTTGPTLPWAARRSR